MLIRRPACSLPRVVPLSNDVPVNIKRLLHDSLDARRYNDLLRRAENSVRLHLLPALLRGSLAHQRDLWPKHPRVAAARALVGRRAVVLPSNNQHCGDQLEGWHSYKGDCHGLNPCRVLLRRRVHEGLQSEGRKPKSCTINLLDLLFLANCPASLRHSVHSVPVCRIRAPKLGHGIWLHQLFGQDCGPLLRVWRIAPLPHSHRPDLRLPIPDHSTASSL